MMEIGVMKNVLSFEIWY